jgi:hypothetical protein
MMRVALKLARHSGLRKGGEAVNILGNYFHEPGSELGPACSPGRYRNVSKGASRIARSEREGSATADLVETLTAAFGIDLPQNPLERQLAT